MCVCFVSVLSLHLLNYDMQVVSDSKTKLKILEVCHNDSVGGCHFGWDITAAKVSARYYWKTINQDVADWVCFLYVHNAYIDCQCGLQAIQCN